MRTSVCLGRVGGVSRRQRHGNRAPLAATAPLPLWRCVLHVLRRRLPRQRIIFRLPALPCQAKTSNRFWGFSRKRRPAVQPVRFVLSLRTAKSHEALLPLSGRLHVLQRCQGALCCSGHPFAGIHHLHRPLPRRNPSPLPPSFLRQADPSAARLTPPIPGVSWNFRAPT